MKKIMTLFSSWIDSGFSRFTHWFRSSDALASPSKYVDLAPIDDADKDDVYSEALRFATNNKRVLNIALTGPYGSGKSSIIQSFLRRYRRPALHISLASFDSDEYSEDDGAGRQEIERSILQQMLYGADSNKLPLSRFNRIQTPGAWSVIKSFFIMLGSLFLWYIFDKRAEIISGSFFQPFTISNWLNLGGFAIALTFLWLIVHHIYIVSFGLSLKSVSLKNVEIKPANEDQVSILNRHLDEIVYFFQSTKYDLVIIEDLDRFKKPDLFVTLREINSLVNANAGVRRTIRFLYALRDDIFISTDRTKFFEFIIPVIPIINTSNSIDMMLEQGNRLKMDERLDRQFLREVSRYLNDLRLIQNIFNEYAVYVANLETDGESLLDANKLLALLIYKNVHPRDFELLHRGVGILANILNHQEVFIGQTEATYRDELLKLEERLDTAERQVPIDLKELQYVFAMAVIEVLPANCTRLSIDGNNRWISLSNLLSESVFNELLGASQILITTQNSQQWFDLKRALHSDYSQKVYQQRKSEVEDRAKEKKSYIMNKIIELRSKISKVRTHKLKELLRLNKENVEILFEEFDENGELARFLLLEGYIDDTYYQYTSLFHSGRLSPNDNKFLIHIRSFVTPEPSYQIDNPEEVIAAMRYEDFECSYILNVILVDTLLDNKDLYQNQIEKLIRYISEDFKNCETFMQAYYNGGNNISELIAQLTKVWDGFVKASITSSYSVHHVTQLLLHLPIKTVESLSREFPELSKFVSENFQGVLTQCPELEPERFISLDFDVKDFTEIKEYPEIARTLFVHGNFDLTKSNLEYIYFSILSEKDSGGFHTRNYTKIRALNNTILTERIERDFELYLRDILLELPDNINEDVDAIIDVISHDGLDTNTIQDFLVRQEAMLPNLENIPNKVHSILFDLLAIEPHWLNCLSFMEQEEFNAESLFMYLSHETIQKNLLKKPIPGDNDFSKLREFIYNANSLSNKDYRAYVRALPNPFNVLPREMDTEKLKILIEEGKVRFTKDILDAFADKNDLQVQFVSKNIPQYLDNPGDYELNDDLKEALLQTEISISSKIALIRLMSLEDLVNRPERASLIGQIIIDSNAQISGLDSAIVQSLIRNSTRVETKIKLFNKFHSLLEEAEVRQVLIDLPKPLSEIKTGYHSPKLKNTPENTALVQWLDSRNIISSWSESSLFTNEIKVNLYRR